MSGFIVIIFGHLANAHRECDQQAQVYKSCLQRLGLDRLFDLNKYSQHTEYEIIKSCSVIDKVMACYGDFYSNCSSVSDLYELCSVQAAYSIICDKSDAYVRGLKCMGEKASVIETNCDRSSNVQFKLRTPMTETAWNGVCRFLIENAECLYNSINSTKCDSSFKDLVFGSTLAALHSECKERHNITSHVAGRFCSGHIGQNLSIGVRFNVSCILAFVCGILLLYKCLVLQM